MVRGRDEMLLLAVVKVDALSLACPRIVRLVPSERESRDVNWIHAALMMAWGGMSSAVQRIPTVWLLPL